MKKEVASGWGVRPVSLLGKVCASQNIASDREENLPREGC